MRLRRIRELLQAQEFVDLQTLCKELGTSESSVRRDLAELEQAGVGKRVHGGVLASEPKVELDFGRQSKRAPDEKRRIGELAAGLVKDGQTVILDGGSTTAAVARVLASRRLRVITNSLPIAQAFWDSRTAEVTLTGGFLYPSVGVLLGSICEDMLAGVSADLAIMGVGGVTAEGLSNNNTMIVGTEQKMIAAARRVMIVADHGKFGRQAMVPLAPLDVVDVVVSDGALAPEYRRLLQRHKIELHLSSSASPLTSRSPVHADQR